MAVLDDIPGLAVAVIVKNFPVQEFNHDEEGEETSSNAITKYIEATSGEEFGVQMSFTRGFSAQHSVRVDVGLDGKWAESYVYDQIAIDHPRHGVVYSIKSAREVEKGQYFERSFSFSEVNTDDSDVHRVGGELKKTLNYIGNIKVTCCWVDKTGRSHLARSMISDIGNIGTIPEKALKGSSVSHQASLKERKPTDIMEMVEASYPYGKIPFATYIFKYRSKKALKSLLIIPRTPSPVPLEERDVDDLSLEEMRELLQRQREREAATSVIKQEGVKRERSSCSETENRVGNNNYDDEVTFVESKRRKLPPSTINEDGLETFDLT
ncbi:hypothetical protein K505DRAFT_412439 [Melanomma pulvis-pyrius CBS 109.77]|uniref:DUF7918 domain-containing protein n=1 Tax=Melanomma pulvis-pyrius CBS 109.77 TaxID=1314802 RepID=A0A6A6XY11_9PLEO|nr:hypothetical protein K505DRAFT_412439 [Melanomma pulvis-pyrius CBS 109.77]